MKFMLLIYDNAGTREFFQSEEGKNLRDEALSIMAELTESGELLSTEGLADPVNTHSLRIENGTPVVTDAPLAESKEFFGGYLRLDVESLERALEIAKSWPSLPYGALELRPIMYAGGEEI